MTHTQTSLDASTFSARPASRLRTSVSSSEPTPPLPGSTRAYRVRLGSVALAIAGLFFVAYPALRPFSDEASLAGAAAFASTGWLAAHMLAMLAFILTTLGLLALHLALQDTPAERLAFRTLIVTWLGVGLLLPFYGAEAFGLHAVGQRALADNSAALVSMADVVRSGAGLVMFLLGLILLGLGSTTAAIAVWRSGRLPQWSGAPFAIGFALYIPQFFAPQPIRVAHGLLVAVGCLWLAAALWRRSIDLA
jgi:hypothetical protein